MLNQRDQCTFTGSVRSPYYHNKMTRTSDLMKAYRGPASEVLILANQWRVVWQIVVK